MGCFRVDPVNELQQVLLLPTKNIQILNSELVTLEGLFNDLEEAETKDTKKKIFGYTVLGLVALFFIMKGLKPEFIWGSANKKGGGDLLPTPNMMETRVVPYEPSEHVGSGLETAIATLDTGSVSLRSGKLIYGLLDDVVLIDKWLATITGHVSHGRPISGFETGYNWHHLSSAVNVSQGFTGSRVSAKLINQLTPPMEQGALIIQNQRPLRSIYEIES